MVVFQRPLTLHRAGDNEKDEENRKIHKIEYVFEVELRNFETDERMAYYQAKHYSPWFEKLKPNNGGRVKKKLVLEQKKLTPQAPNGCSRGISWSKSSGLKTRHSRCKWGQGCCQIG